MIFSDSSFLFLFVPVVMLLYYCVPIMGKNIIIFISGILFYAWGEPKYVIIMILSAAIDYLAGLGMNKWDDKPKIRKIFLLLSVIMNLLLLCVFKYSSFFISNVNTIFNTHIIDPKIILPIGISFYTFQSMSYTIDLYLRQIKVQKNPINFLSYVTLFPQIVAGPIVRYQDVANEIDNRTVNTSMVSTGIGIFLKGLGKKILLADTIYVVWEQVKALDYSQMSLATAWIGILAYTFHIYFDFSGYSEMAVGLGKMLGFNFPMNFNYPYISKSVSEFWRRWHITLGSWFRSYVYIPLGGNRVSKPKILRNLLVVWMLTGFWHGASWNFIIWGLYFGILIIIERLGFGKVLEKLPSVISRLYTFVIVMIGWVFFDITGLGNAWNYLKAMFGSTGVFIDDKAKFLFTSYIALFVICAVLSTEILKKCYEKLKLKYEKLVLVATPVFQVLLLLVSTAFIISNTNKPFIYFRF